MAETKQKKKIIWGNFEEKEIFDIYKINLDKVKYIYAYSDGCEPDFENQKYKADYRRYSEENEIGKRKNTNFI